MARRLTRNFSPSISRGQRRESVWIGFGLTAVSQAAVGGFITHALNAAALAERPFTIVRSRWELYIFSDQTGATESQLGAFGIAVVSDQAVAIGVTAVPTPVTDISSDLWFVHQILLNSMSGGTAQQMQVGTRYTVDSKAMRKVEDGQDIVPVIELDAAGNGFTVLLGGRILIKTH